MFFFFLIYFQNIISDTVEKPCSRAVILKLWSQTLTSASPEIALEMQTQELCLRPTESETLG